MYQGGEGWKQDLGGAPGGSAQNGSLLGSCDTLGKSLLSKPVFLPNLKICVLNIFAILIESKKLMSFGRCCVTFCADSHVQIQNNPW